MIWEGLEMDIAQGEPREKTLNEIVAGTELREFLELMDQDDRLDNLLFSINTFCRGKPKVGDTTMDYSVCNQYLTEKVVEHAFNMVQTYSEDGLDMFSGILRTLQYLPEEDKLKYISHFDGFSVKDGGEHSKIFGKRIPQIMDTLLTKLNEMYEPQFEKLDSREIKSKAPKYMVLVNKLKEDLDRVVLYTGIKIEQSCKLDSRGRDITYEECFGSKNLSTNFKVLTPAYVSSLIRSNGNGNGSIKSAIDKQIIERFGNPVGMAVKGLRDSESTTIVLWFKNPENQRQPIRVPMNYSRGLTSHEGNFYLSLANKCKVDPAFVAVTGKCKKHIAQYAS